jgi:hypothetical protein
MNTGGLLAAFVSMRKTRPSGAEARLLFESLMARLEVAPFPIRALPDSLMIDLK